MEIYKVATMTIWGKLAGAAAGAAIGGPIGGLLGGLAGHFADRVIDSPEQKKARDQLVFTAGVIALGAKMAKADGVVTKDEIEAFREVFRIEQKDAKNVARLFNLAKQDVAGYEAYADQLAQLLRDNPKLLEDVLDGLFHIALADHRERHMGQRGQIPRSPQTSFAGYGRYQVFFCPTQ